MISIFNILIIIAIIVRGSTTGLGLLVSIVNSHNSSSSIYINMLTFDKNNYPFNINYNNIIHIKNFHNLYYKYYITANTNYISNKIFNN